MDHPKENNENEKKYWVSHDQDDAKTGEFVSTPAKPTDAAEGIASHDGLDSESRRDFLKLMGASFALMGTAACTRSPVEKIIPYVNKPEEITPGIANWYASTCNECEARCGVLVKTREARPIKFEGNPKHAVAQGGLCARGQASVLNLYDPDRLQAPLAPSRKGSATGIDWADLDAKIVEKIRSSKGKVRILMAETPSPSTTKIVSEFASQAGAGEAVIWSPLGVDEFLEGQGAAYGSRTAPRLRFDRADYVLSFGADFLGTWLSPVGFNKDFSKRKKLGSMASGSRKEPVRFVALESNITLTGTNADERMRVPSGGELRAALAIAHEIIVSQGRSRFSGDSTVRALLESNSVNVVSKDLGLDAASLKKIANELWSARGSSIVVGAGHNLKGSAGRALEVVVALLNSALENEGSTIDGTVSPFVRRTNYDALAKLIGEIKAGAVDVLVIANVNPLYSLPKSAGLEEALSKVSTVVYVGDKFDETARAADYVAARSHALEAWGDAQAQDDLFTIQQPTIRPLYNTRSFEETLMAWAKKLGFSGPITSSATWHDYVRTNWKDSIYRSFSIATPFALFWESLLREGVFDGVAAKGSRELGSTRARSFNSSSLRLVSESLSKKGASANELKLVLYPKISIYDGQNANNGWLQELPDPVSKITWDNYASMSVAAAKKLGVVEGDVVKLKTESGELSVPAHVQPGLHDEVIALAVGYGRTGAGRVADGVGVNAYKLAVAKDTLEMAALKVAVEKTGAREKLAATQMHHSLEGRPIVREASYKAYASNPAAGHPPEHPTFSIWPEHKFPGYRWGMAIDLNSCTGCGACVIGCQSENNIPIVGKKFVDTGREMHWIRIDRYYTGSVENPQVVHQPMLCQHCENAPCETVCPVLATLHDDEGLNQQIYNRCVGTRYCANNCPYKVRRFNWFTFTEVAKPMHLVYNPDLTVRTRGVMEKCTFCVQRIRDGKDRAKDMGVTAKDGDIQTACQQSCPSDAIVFGNINDKNSRVAKIAADPRGYHVLKELNVKPSITYLTKIRNNNA